jgi:transcriptional regulator with XRE-family HTH domain
MLEERISTNIQQLRKNAKMSLQDLAARTGLTKSYLSKIERKIQTPSFSSISRIAIALGVDTTSLLTERAESLEDVRISFTKKGERKVIAPVERSFEGSVHGIIYEAIAYNKPGKNMNPIVLTIPPEGAPVFQHEGEEFIYILEGRHEFTYDDHTYIMEEGDSVYLDAAVPHTGKGLDGKPAKILVVMFNYRRF